MAQRPTAAYDVVSRTSGGQVAAMSRTDDPEWTASDTDPRDDAGESLEAMIERADHAFAAESFGTTAEEQGRGESLDDRLAEERTDAPTSEIDLAIEDADAPDTEPKMIG